MNTKNRFYYNFNQAQGFSTSFALGLGLITIMASTIAIMGAQQEKNNAIIQGKISRSLNAAQIGVTHYRDFINQNKIIATHPACINWNNNNDTCQDASSDISWAKASNIPGINPACPNRGANIVAAETNRNWQNVSNISSAQYRLYNYTYTFDNTTNTGTGKLVVEGRANDSAEAATSRLEVELPIQPGISNAGVPAGGLGPRFNSLDPAVWIGNSAVTAIGNLTVDGNILFSNANCNLPSGTGQPTGANLRDPNLQSIITDPRTLANIPTVPGTVNTVTSTDISNATQLPRTTDSKDNNNFYHYTVTGGLNLSGKTLKISPGTKVILYVDGNITLNGNVDINQGSNSSAYLEIYGKDTTTSINFTGSGQQNIKAFIHAPKATVKIAPATKDSCLTVNVTGAMWVKDWDASSVNNSCPDPSDPSKVIPNGVINITADEQYINYGTVKGLIAQGSNRVVDPVIYPPNSFKY